MFFSNLEFTFVEWFADLLCLCFIEVLSFNNHLQNMLDDLHFIKTLGLANVSYYPDS